MTLSPSLKGLRSFHDAERVEARTRWITQVCTIAFGHTDSIASGRPLSPSTEPAAVPAQARVLRA
jgi:hypothetical protein